MGGGRLRASHADRDHVIGTLKAAFVQGRLTKDELDLRVGQTLSARTYGDLAALTADLPPGLTGARSPGSAARAQTRRPVRAAKAAVGVGLALALLAAAVFSGPGNGPERLIFLAVFFIPVCGLLLGGLLMLHSWLEKRSERGQLPPSPKQGGLAVEGEHNGAPGDDRILCEARRDVRHLPGHGVCHRIYRSLRVWRHQHRPSNNEAERTIRPVKVQQRGSGGCWRTLQGLAQFALVQSYLSTAAKWGLSKLDALRALFKGRAWLPPGLEPA